MDIQQTDKELLAAYVHRFKWEASRYKFNNDAATIGIFLKGLKSAHTIATKVYEKGPQTLVETIKEVERLPSCTANNFHPFAYFISQYNVQQQQQVLLMSRDWPYGMLLSPHKML